MKYTEQDLIKVHEEYIDSDFTRMATKEVNDAYKKLCIALDDYVSAVCEFEFCNGFLYAQHLKDCDNVPEDIKR